MARIWMAGFLAVGMALGVPAWAGNAKQVSHSIEEGPSETTLHFAWQGAGTGKESISVVVSTAEIEADKEVKRKIQLKDLYDELAKAARQSGKKRKQVKLTAKATPKGVQLGASGPRKAAKAAMAEAQDAMEARRQSWMVENQVFEVESGALSYDHVAVVADRTSAVAPVASALREGTSSEREFIKRTLGFAQAIPYQKGKRGADSGFQRPMALMARNKGDCDGKAALFLALIHAELPDVPLAMVYIPGHALVGLGIPPKDGDKTFKHNGKTFVYAEPVGPGALPLGQVAPPNKRAVKRAMVRVVP